MDGTKLDISGKPVKDSSSATYKQIPESDLEVADEAVTQSKGVVKPKLSSPEKDGADEKMLPDDQTKVAENSNVNSADVKFISNEKQNGDAKVDIGELKTAFVGMGKEELMKYANDPFWIRLRWFLFISFWLIWAAMLVGAILIIVAAPKCSPPEPRTWWEEGPLTEVELETTANELKELKEQGVQGVIVTWPGDSYQMYNESSSFMTFLQRAKDTETNIIIDLKPGTSRTWFVRSEDEGDDGDFNNYYIWALPKGFNDSNNPIEPNNWKSKQNVSSWKFSTKRNKFFLSPEDSPQLNFSNPKVVDEFSTILRNYLDAGVKGIRLTGAPYLLVDRNLKDEEHSRLPGFYLTDYGFYTHTNTEYRDELGPLIKQWRDVVKSKLPNAPFILTENVLKNLDKFKVNNTLMIDLPSESSVFSNKKLSASQINSNLSVTFLLLENKYWPLWQHNTSSLPSDVLDIVTMLLPGTTLIDKNATVAKDLLNIRKSASILHGNTTTYLIANNTVFAYGRLTPGNPGYLVALNPTNKTVKVDFPSEISTVSEEVTVQFFSKNYNETDIEIKKKTNAHQVPISPESAIVLSYVPKS
ncbi:hypothetical protein ILUMI_00304 [Ignelater luminosus]|uniref:alpha-glucosidase n=1 Tax=Ignelater luminosus TaxID=2038154 RepID=A0A8K0GQC8_IGNLU|nr:hypothetical protein ILUMI_00304 [Ignelater luminosus]